MIAYSDHESPFFLINRSELDLFLNSDTSSNVTGWCNAYGFKIEVVISNGSRINYSKSQLSHQDPVIPRRATSIYEWHLELKRDWDSELHFGKWSWVYFWLKKIKVDGCTFRIKEFQIDLLPELCKLLKITHAERCSFKNGKLRLWSRQKQESIKTIHSLTS